MLPIPCSPAHEPRRRHPSAGGLALVCVLLLAACGEDSVDPNVPLRPAGELAAAAEVAFPAAPIREMELVEDYSEAVANRMLGFADKLRRRDFDATHAWLATGFAGHAFDSPRVGADELPLGARRAEHGPGERIVGPADFIDSIAAWIAPWNRVESVLWKVKGAEFETGTPLWGRVRFRVTILGTGEEGGPRSIVAWGAARMLREKGQWMLAAFELESLTVQRRDEYLFTDVSTSAGVAHSGIRFGQAGNDSFAWNGAACGDADGDGLFDLFVPSRPNNFLYLARHDAESEPARLVFEDQAERCGVRGPAGGTGAVFFDHDNDGDQDLALGDVGWEEADGSSGGNPLRLYVNAGDGRFKESGRALGFGARMNTYTVVLLDADLDGFLDVFCCNYGRVEAQPNNSWVDATNGMPNALFANRAGRGFEQVASAVGLVDSRWSYAGAAADFDLDGDTDLYVANDYAQNQFWRNEGSRFTEVSEDFGVSDLGNGMGASWADLNNDGALDLYVANMSSTAGNRILGRLSNQGDEAWKSLSKMAAGNSIFFAGGDDFERSPSSAGGIGGSWAWAPAIVDLDLDGRLDVYCANGFVTGDTLADT